MGITIGEHIMFASEGAHVLQIALELFEQGFVSCAGDGRHLLGHPS
jgi:hypothetical protein